MIVPGDYMLATKWSDGDPKDQWAVGFYDKEENGRHFVVDENGKQFRRKCLALAVVRSIKLDQ